MRIVIATTYVPFIAGGGRMIVDSLETELRKRGHQVDTAWIPLRSHWPELAQQTLAIRLLDLTEAVGLKTDRLIAIRYPSYAIRHPNKVCWFIHHHRGAYDLWGTPYQDIPATPEGVAVREALIRSDTIYLKEAKKIFANSKVVAGRLRRFNGIEVDGVLYPPLPNPEMFRPGDFGPYFLYSSRLTPIKRQTLAIEAMRHVRSNFKLMLAGTPDEEHYLGVLAAMVSSYGLTQRVELLGWVDEQRKAQLTSGCLAALYVPYEEDSYGYPTLEAFHSGKPVITCTDSGGPSEIVQHGHNGLIVEPEPEHLAQAMEALWADRDQTARMGGNAQQSLEGYRINWDTVIDRLLEPA